MTKSALGTRSRTALDEAVQKKSFGGSMLDGDNNIILPDKAVATLPGRFGSSIKLFAQAVGRTEDEVKDWLSSNQFAPFMRELCRDWYDLRSIGDNSTGINIDLVIPRIEEDSRNGGGKYDEEDPDKSKWTQPDHMARFLVKSMTRNKSNVNGWLWDTKYNLDQQYSILWQAKSLALNLRNRAKKRTSGTVASNIPVTLYGTSRRRTDTPDPLTIPSSPPVDRDLAATSSPTPASHIPLDFSLPDFGTSFLVRKRAAADPMVDLPPQSMNRRHRRHRRSVPNSENEEVPESDPDNAGRIRIKREPGLVGEEPGMATGEEDSMVTPFSWWGYKDNEHVDLVDDETLHDDTPVDVTRDMYESQSLFLPEFNDDDPLDSGNPNRDIESDEDAEQAEAVEEAEKKVIDTRTIFERIKASAPDIPNLNDPYWRLAAINSITRQTKIPVKIFNVLDFNSDEVDVQAAIDKINAESENWKVELDTILQSDHSTAAGPVTRQQIEQFKKEENFLNVNPIINVNLDVVKAELGLIGRDYPRLPGQPANIQLTTLQIVGIYRLWKMTRVLKAVILADSMGLGKTCQMFSFFLLLNLKGKEKHERQKAETPADCEPPPRVGKVKLVVVPQSVIGQMFHDGAKFAQGALDFYEYYGDERKLYGRGGRSISGRLTVDHDFFKGTPEELSRKVIITSHGTWSQRHGPDAVFKWLVEGGMDKARAEKEKWYYHPDCPAVLRHLIEALGLDEGHAVKRAECILSYALSWLDPENMLLLTATPGINSINDFRGYFRFCQPRHPILKDNGEAYTITDARNGVNPYKDGTTGIGFQKPLLVLNEHMAQEHIFENPNQQVAAVNLRKVLAKCMLRRTYATKINGVLVGAEIPSLARFDCVVHFDAKVQAEYDKHAIVHLRGLTIALANGQLCWDASKARQLHCNSLWLGYEFVGKCMMATHMEQLKKQPAKKLHALLLQYNNLADKEWDLPSINNEFDPLELLNFILDEAPKLRALLAILADELLLAGNKVAVWTTYPAEQFLVTTCLGLLQIDAHMISSDMTKFDRDRLVANFNINNNMPEVLILSYSLSSCGLNLQYACHVCVHLSIPLSDDVRDQSDHRFRRIGAIYDVKSYGLSVSNTFDDKRYQNLLKKGAPQLITQMNGNKFGVRTNKDPTGLVTVVVNSWAVDGAGNLVYAPNADIAQQAGLRILDIDGIIAQLQSYKRGKATAFDIDI